jgi:alkylation response protein AidB-like acyl-CoA dehydrogenase
VYAAAAMLITVHDTRSQSQRAAIAKLYATESAVNASADCHPGVRWYGFMEEYPVGHSFLSRPPRPWRWRGHVGGTAVLSSPAGSGFRVE